MDRIKNANCREGFVLYIFTTRSESLDVGKIKYKTMALEEVEGQIYEKLLLAGFFKLE
jgi:hypothetical protein